MIKINLLPYRAERKKEFIKKQVFFGALPLLVACLIIGLIWWSTNAEYTRVLEEISVVKNKIEKSKLKMQDIENYKSQKEKLAKKMDIIKTLEKNKSGPVRMIDQISICLPGGLWLTELVQKGGNLVLEGTALDNISISKYMVRLEESPNFSDVDLLEIKTSKKKAVKGRKPLKGFKLQSKVVYKADAANSSN